MSIKIALSSFLRDELFLFGKTLSGEAKCLDIEMKGDCVILKFDCHHFTNKVLNNLHKAGKSRSISDYVIISDEVILVCEMKSENTSGKALQLKCSAAMVEYILKVAKLLNKELKVPPIKFVCFSSKNNGKQKSISKKLEYIEWEKSALYNLACNSIYSIKQFC
ncbi:MAG: hypothetical protein QM541_10555 [Flavobacterium sp.]|nr:hypothetical protein [Flavobacterium sp.]